MQKEELFKKAQEEIYNSNETPQESLKKLEEAGKDFNERAPTTFFIGNNPLAKKIESFNKEEYNLMNNAIQKKFTNK